MRIPFTRIYRAFPELDRFSDEQCERFVHAATRTGVRRHVHRALLLVLLLALGLGSAVLLRAVANAAGPGWDPRWPLAARGGLLWLLLAVACPAIPPALTLVARDFLLRRRLRRVLRVSGVCPACRYSLIGLPVSAENTVVCPECGGFYEVDPSLSALMAGGDGSRLLEPAVVARRVVFWTPARLRQGKRLLIAAGILLLVGPPLGWGMYELFLLRQAGVARRERPGSAAIMEFVELHQPAGLGEEEPNAFYHFDRAGLLLSQADGAVIPSPPDKDVRGRAIYPEFSLVYTPPRSLADAHEEDLAFDEACRALALKCLDEYAAQGVFEELGEMAGARRAVRPLPGGWTQPFLLAPLPDLGEARLLARISVARMFVARERGDLAEFADAFESTLALARLMAHQPGLINGLVALAIEALAIDQAEEVLGDRPDGAWIDAIEAAMARQRSELPRDYHLQGERLFALDTVAWAFSEPSRVRLGRFSRLSRAFWADSFGEGRLGTYAENRDTVDAYFASACARADYDAHNRPPDGGSPEGLVLIDLLLPATDRYLATCDQAETERRGLAALIALERYRIDHRVYPAELRGLAPAYLSAIPVDVWTGKPLIYRLGDSSADAFLLYATGIDGVDNGGAAEPGKPARAARHGGEGLDYPIGKPSGSGARPR